MELERRTWECVRSLGEACCLGLRVIDAQVESMRTMVTFILCRWETQCAMASAPTYETPYGLIGRRRVVS